jgi:NADPH-dependent curcumin reductase CurA
LNSRPVLTNVLAKLVTVAMWVMLHVIHMTSYHTDQSGLFQAGKMKSGETVLVTAAAGGTGQFAVQVNNFPPVLMFSHFL